MMANGTGTLAGGNGAPLNTFFFKNATSRFVLCGANCGGVSLERKLLRIYPHMLLLPPW